MMAPGIAFRSKEALDNEYALDCLVRTSREKAQAEGLDPEADEVIRSRMRYYVEPRPQGGFLSRLMARQRSLPHEVLIALDENGERVGCLVIDLKQDDGALIAWVYLVFVEPDHRHIGIGTEIMAKAEEWGRASGAVSMMLNVWSSNSTALLLYESTGYETDRLWMKKKL